MENMSHDVIRLALPESFFEMVGLGHLFADEESRDICQNRQTLPNSCICLGNKVDVKQKRLLSLHKDERA